MRNLLLIFFLGITFLSFSNERDYDKEELFKKEKIKSLERIYYKYDESGKIDTLSKRIMNRILLDEHGRVIKSFNMQDPFYRKENVFFETINYTYSEDGDLAERIITDYKGKIKSKSLFEYKNNNIRERIQYGPNELFLHKAIIFADDKGRDTLCVVYDKEGNLTNKYTMVHDEVGIKEEVSYNNNSVVSRKVRINDDADRREYLVYDAAELRSRFIEVYRDNRLVEEITKNEDDLYIYNNYEVTLDYVMSSSHFDRRRRHFFYDNGLTKEVIQYGLDDKLENLTITEYERWE